MTLDSKAGQSFNTFNNAAESAEIAAMALQYLADDGELLSRFLALTGLEPGQLRKAASQPGFLVGVLDFFLNFEPNLLAFAQARNIKPEDVVKARAFLNQGTNTDD